MEVSEIKFHEMVDKARMVINQPKSKNAKKSPFINQINRIFKQIQRIRWFKKELTHDATLLECLKLMIILVHAYTQIADDQYEKSLIMATFEYTKSCVSTNIFSEKTSLYLSSALEWFHYEQMCYKCIKTGCLAFRSNYSLLSDYDIQDDNENESPDEKRKRKIYQKLIDNSCYEIEELVKLFSNRYRCEIDLLNISQEIIKKNIHRLIQTMIQYPNYFAILHFYFFLTIDQKSRCLLCDYDKNDFELPDGIEKLFFPTLRLKKYMRTRYASAECIQLFNDIANIFAHNPNSIWNTVSGFAIFNEERTRQLLEIYVTLCDEDNDASYFEPQGDEEYYDYIQSTESDENNDYEGVSKDFDEYSEWLSYRKKQTADFDSEKIAFLLLYYLNILRYEPLTREQRKQLTKNLKNLPGYHMVLWLLRILNNRTILAIKCDAEPSTQTKSAIEQLYTAITSIAKDTVGPDVSLRKKYEYIWKKFDIKQDILSGIGYCMEIGNHTDYRIAYNARYYGIYKDIMQFIKNIENRREKLYPQWFKDYQDNHSILSPSEQIYVLNKREKIVRHAWKIEDYIKFTQIYTDKSTFTHWIQTQIQEDSNIATASKNTNKPKAKQPDAESDLYNNVVETEALRNHIAAAAFYQMISNLIYFLREEMLSLL